MPHFRKRSKAARIRRARHNKCTRKRRYDTISDVFAVLSDMRLTGALGIFQHAHIYPCGHCGGFHWGRQNNMTWVDGVGWCTKYDIDELTSRAPYRGEE